MTFSPKGLVGPLLLGLAGGVAGLFVGWWCLLVLVGFVIGYADRSPLAVRREPSTDA